MKAGTLAAIAVGLLGAPVLAAGAAAKLEPFKPDLADKASLQRGMALFANFCQGCHSLKFQRYERTADDLDIPHDVAQRNLIFTGQAIGELMETAMPPSGAKNWFGVPPPDLTMVDRVRGTAWVYNMLKGFYVDETRPFGVNNRVFENIAMPHALLPLQGVPKMDCRGKKALDILADRERLLARDVTERRAREANCAWTRVAPGTGMYTEAEFDQAAGDIANFLHYVGEPGREERHRIGYWVLAFLAGLFVLATLLNREYWKDVRDRR